ncbi:MAG: ComF family protein [Verrucomicrobiota bacterium]|nr:ComF family protein [Verrucomicrobiota bacterium]
MLLPSQNSSASSCPDRQESLWHKLWAGALDLAFPRHCEGCGGTVDEASGWQWLCSECREDLPIVEPPCCRTCGYPYYGLVESSRSCPHCATLEPLFDEGRTLLLHRGSGAELVKCLKYRQGTHLMSDIRQLAAQRPWLAEYLRDAVVLPVPLHPRKERERGFNQSALLAKAFVEGTGQGRVEQLLQRVRDTPTQTRLTRVERVRNLKNAFALKPKTTLAMDLTYIMVDDVFTTGSTLNACAQALRASGATKLKVLTLAHG